MVRAAALILLAQVGDEGPVLIDPPPVEWITENAPYGFDVTRDGHVWVSLNQPGRRDDYSVLASDLREQTKDYRTVWIRGYHRRNPDTKLRETKRQFRFYCPGKTFQTLYRAGYAADGSLALHHEANENARPIIPGSLAEEWYRIICRSATR